MGMFDDILWNFALEAMPLGTKFQTKDLGEGLHEYEVSKDGHNTAGLCACAAATTAVASGANIDIP